MLFLIVGLLVVFFHLYLTLYAYFKWIEWKDRARYWHDLYFHLANEHGELMDIVNKGKSVIGSPSHMSIDSEE